MSIQKVAIKYLLVTAALFTVGCSGKGDNKGSEQVLNEDVSEYKEASCLYKYEEGGQASVSDANDVRNTFFKKKLNFGLLAPVLEASAGETVRFAESQNVIFYKTTYRNTDSCEFLGSLPSAPSDLTSEFSKYNADDSILGLYLSAGTKHLPSTSSQAAILVRRDANKWILVHEYMHHLYQIQRDAEVGIQTESVKERLARVGKEYDQAVNDLKSASSTDRPEKLAKASQKLVEFNNVVFDFLREYLLEEMSIENVLGQKHAYHELKYVVGGQRVNGAAYTIVSGKRAKEQFLSVLEKENSQFVLRNQLELTFQDRSNIFKLNSEIESIKYEIDNLTQQAKSFLSSRGLEYKGLRSVMGIVASSETHFGCSHQKDVDEVEQYLKNRQH